MTILKIEYKALVMEHCLSKVEDLNVDRERPFAFFKFSFFVCVYVCVRVHLLYSCLHFHSYLRTIYVFHVYYLLHFDSDYRSSPPEVFLGKGVLKICSKFTG